MDTNINTPKVTVANRAEGISRAGEWLDKAIKLEAEGKSARMVDMALNRAVEFENAAFAFPA